MGNLQEKLENYFVTYSFFFWMEETNRNKEIISHKFEGVKYNYNMGTTHWEKSKAFPILVCCGGCVAFGNFDEAQSGFKSYGSS